MTSTHRNQPERASNFGIAFLIGVMKLTGPRFVKLLVVPVALYYFLSSPNTRKVSNIYLTQLRRFSKARGMPIDLPGNSLRWLTFKHILSFARSIVDRVHVWSAGAGAIRYQVEGRELMENVLSDERHGALFLVSHLGNFDLAMACSEYAIGNRFTVVLATASTRKYNKFRDKIFKSEQVQFIEPGALTPTKVVSLIERVANGEVIIIAADRVFNANAKNSARVDFLGGKAAFPSGPFIIAHLLEVPVYCIFALQKRDSCLIRFEMFEQKVLLPRKQRQLAIRRYAQKFAARLERECLDFPLQWYNFYDFWACSESNPQTTPTTQGGHNASS